MDGLYGGLYVTRGETTGGSEIQAAMLNDNEPYTRKLTTLRASARLPLSKAWPDNTKKVVVSLDRKI